MFGREAEGEQDADFRGALFEAELKEEGHEQQGGDDQEDAEAEKELAEVLGLGGGLEGLLADGLEAEAEGLRAEVAQEVLFQRALEFFRVKPPAGWGSEWQ